MIGSPLVLMSANVNLLAFEDSVQAALAQTDDEEYGI